MRLTNMAGPTLSRLEFGHFMQSVRKKAPRTALMPAALHIESTHPVLLRLEGGAVTKLKTADIKGLLDFYEATPEDRSEALRLWVEVQEQDKAARAQGDSRGFWKAYADKVAPHFEKFLRLEGVADRITTFEPVIVPGLLQVPAYRRGMIRTNNPRASTEQIERQLALTAKRQARLDDPALRLSVFLSEATLLNRPCGPEGMASQLLGLADTGQRENVSVRVVPFSAGPHRGLTIQAFSLLGFPKGESGMVLPSVVYAEGALGSLFHEHDEEVSTYRDALESLQEVALSEKDTWDLVSRVAKEYAA